MKFSGMIEKIAGNAYIDATEAILRAGGKEGSILSKTFNSRFDKQLSGIRQGIGNLLSQEGGGNPMYQKVLRPAAKGLTGEGLGGAWQNTAKKVVETPQKRMLGLFKRAPKTTEEDRDILDHIAQFAREKAAKRTAMAYGATGVGAGALYSEGRNSGELHERRNRMDKTSNYKRILEEAARVTSDRLGNGDISGLISKNRSVQQAQQQLQSMAVQEAGRPAAYSKLLRPMARGLSGEGVRDAWQNTAKKVVETPQKRMLGLFKRAPKTTEEDRGILDHIAQFAREKAAKRTGLSYGATAAGAGMMYGAGQLRGRESV